MARDEINAFLGSGAVYTGDLSFEGAVRIDGVFSGNISSDGTLIIGQGAKVTGKIKVGSLVASGTIDGEIMVAQKAVLHKSAVVQGKLVTALLVMEEGALLDGNLAMKNSALDRADIAVPDKNDGQWDMPKDSIQ